MPNQITGLQLTLSAIRRFNVETQTKIKEIVEDTTKMIEMDAISNAPGAGDMLTLSNGGHMRLDDNLRGMIDSEVVNNGFTGKVFVSSLASKFFVYVEFGTGADAARYVPTLPQEFQDFARKYYVNGKGKIIGQPFLLPAYFQHRDQFIEDLRRAIGAR